MKGSMKPARRLNIVLFRTMFDGEENGAQRNLLLGTTVYILYPKITLQTCMSKVKITFDQVSRGCLWKPVATANKNAFNHIRRYTNYLGLLLQRNHFPIYRIPFKTSDLFRSLFCSEYQCQTCDLPKLCSAMETKTKPRFMFDVLLLCLFLNIHFQVGTDTISTDNVLSTVVSASAKFEMGLFQPGRSPNYYEGFCYS